MCPLGTSDYITFWFTKKFVIPVVNKAIVVCLNEIHFFHIKSLDLNSTQLVHDLNTNLSLMNILTRLPNWTLSILTSKLRLNNWVEFNKHFLCPIYSFFNAIVPATKCCKYNSQSSSVFYLGQTRRNSWQEGNY